MDGNPAASKKSFIKREEKLKDRRAKYICEKREVGRKGGVIKYRARGRKVFKVCAIISVRGDDSIW